MTRTIEWVESMVGSPHNGVCDFVIISCDMEYPAHYGRAIGKIGCWDGTEIGFLLNRAHWGKGYASEAVGAVLNHMWKTEGVMKVTADVDPRNEACLRVLRKFLFKETGRAEKTFETELGWCDSVYLELKRP